MATDSNTPADPLLALGSRPREYKDVFVAAAGTEYRVYELDAAGRDRLDRLLGKGKTDETRATVLALTLHHKNDQPAYPVQGEDADGVPQFAPGVIAGLQRLPARIAEALFRTACRLNGLNEHIEGTDAKGN